MDVTDAGRYKISGRLCECGAMSSHDYVDHDSNMTDLNAGNQTVQLSFYGITLRQNGYDGRYDLRDICLYNATDSYSHPLSAETPMPVATPTSPASEGSEELMKAENITALYEQIDHRDIAYTTSYYNYTDFQRPPAEFNDVYTDYGNDTDGDGLYDHLVVEIGVDVIETGYYLVTGELYESNSYNSSGHDSNTTYLSNGSQTIRLRFEGMRIRQNKYSGTYDLKYLYLYNSSTGIQCGCVYNAYTTSYYNYTDFQRPPAEFNDVYTDYGNDTDGDGLYDHLVVEIGVDVIETGYYLVTGELYESNSYNSSGHDSNTTYLSNGSQTIRLRFEGMRIRQNKYSGTYDLKYLYLYNSSTGIQCGCVYNAYTTSYYNYTDFQTNPPCYNYTTEYVTYVWDAIESPDQIWTSRDDCSYKYILPWNFTFFCEDHSSIHISTNGLITFPPDTSSHSSPDFENTVAIAPFWGDLSQACGQGTHVSVQDKGDRVVVVWYTGTYSGGCLDKDLFEAILYENGEIRFNYNYLNNIPYSVGAGISNEIVYYINTWNDGMSVVYSPASVAETVHGDLNGDNQITPADAAIALQIAATGGWDPAADVDGDNRITSLDALMILQAATAAIEL